MISTLCVLLLITVNRTSATYWNCIKNIAEQYFPPVHTVVISTSITSSNFTLPSTVDVDREFDESRYWLDYLHSTEKWPLIVINFMKDDGEDIVTTKSNIRTYILTSNQHNHSSVVQDLTFQVKRLRSSPQFNARAKFVIVLKNPQENSKTLARTIFSSFWIFRIINIIILISDSEIVDIYTWFPYDPPGTCPQNIEPNLVNRCLKNGNFSSDSSLFPPKIPDDLNGCPVSISTFNIPPAVTKKYAKEVPGKIFYDYGIEVKIIEEFARRTNETIVYRPPPSDEGYWGYKLPNGSWSGITGEVSKADGDIALAFLWANRCPEIKENECLRPFLVDKLKWFVPCAEPYPRWSSLTRVFKFSLWASFLASYVVASLAMWQVVKWNYKFSNADDQNQAFASLVGCLLNFWAIILEESASNNPPHIPSIRLVFLTWVLYCWAVNNVYQTFFTSFLIDPGLQHQISTEEEILSGIKYSTEVSITSLYPILLSKRYENLLSCNNITYCIGKIANGEQMAFLFPMYVAHFDIAVNYMDADGNPRVCEIEDDLASSLITIYVPKGSPMKPRYDKLMLDLLQGGLVNHWWSEVKYIANLEMASNFNLPSGDYIEMTIEHLQSAFYFLFLGYVLSTVSFIVEIFMQVRKNRTRAKLGHRRRSNY